MNPRQLKELQAVPVKYVQIVERAYEGNCPPRNAIKAFCLYCTGYMRLEVANCTSLACPLHAFRPYQQGSDDEAELAEGSGSDLPNVRNAA